MNDKQKRKKKVHQHQLLHFLNMIPAFRHNNFLSQQQIKQTIDNINFLKTKTIFQNFTFLFNINPSFIISFVPTMFTNSNSGEFSYLPSLELLFYDFIF